MITTQNILKDFFLEGIQAVEWIPFGTHQATHTPNFDLF